VTIGVVAIDRISTGLGSHGEAVVPRAVLNVVRNTALRPLRHHVDLSGELGIAVGIAVEVIWDFGGDVAGVCVVVPGVCVVVAGTCAVFPGACVVVPDACAVFGVTTADLSVGVSTRVTVDIGAGRINHINHINRGDGVGACAGAGSSTDPAIGTVIELWIGGRTRIRDAPLGADRLSATHYPRLD
jgi:hypothetical protein